MYFSWRSPASRKAGGRPAQIGPGMPGTSLLFFILGARSGSGTRKAIIIPAIQPRPAFLCSLKIEYTVCKQFHSYGFCFGRHDCLRPSAGKKGGFFRLLAVKAITSKVRAGPEKHIRCMAAPDVIRLLIWIRKYPVPQGKRGVLWDRLGQNRQLPSPSVGIAPLRQSGLAYSRAGGEQ